MTTQTQGAILSGLKATGGIVASLGGMVAGFSAVQGFPPQVGLWIAVAGVVIHGISTAINELVSIFQTVPVEAAPPAAAPASAPASAAPSAAPKVITGLLILLGLGLLASSAKAAINFGTSARVTREPRPLNSLRRLPRPLPN
jgi:hypothetical protein